VLLGTTRLTLKEVAGRCGFRDGAQLTRSFTRCFGLSPRGYRLVNGRPLSGRWGRRPTGPRQRPTE